MGCGDAAVAHGLPGSFRNGDGQVGVPIGSEVEVSALLPLADRAYPALDEGEPADEPLQPFEIVRSHRLIALEAPETKAPVPRPTLGGEKPALAQPFGLARVDEGKPCRDERPVEVDRP